MVGVQARETAPSVILLDELDSIGAARDSSSAGSGAVAERALSTLLNEMDGVGHQKDTAVKLQIICT